MKSVPEEETDNVTNQDVRRVELWIYGEGYDGECDGGRQAHDQEGKERDAQRSEPGQLY